MFSTIKCSIKIRTHLKTKAYLATSTGQTHALQLCGGAVASVFSLSKIINSTLMSPQNNYMAFMAELFWWFEVVKPSFVKPQLLSNESAGKS